MNSNLLVESFQADISHLQWKIDLLRSHLLDTNDQVQFIQDQIQHQFQLQQQLTKTLTTYNQDQYEELRGKNERNKKLKPLKLEIQIPKLVEESDLEDEEELGNQDLYQHYKEEEEDNQHEIFVPESLNSQVLFDSELATNHWFQLDNENQRGKVNESIKESYFTNVYETDDEVENNEGNEKEEIFKFQCVYVYESPPPSPRVSQSIEDLQSEDSLEVPQQVPKSRTIRRIVYEESDDDGDSKETQIQTQTQIQVAMDSEQRGSKELSPSKQNILSSQVQIQVNSNEIARVSNSPPSKRCSPLQQQQQQQKEQEEIEKEEKQESSFKKRNDDDDVNECESTKQKKKRSKRIEAISDDLSSDFEIVRRPRSFPPPNYKESSYKPYRYRKPKIQINQDSYQFRKHKPEVQFLNRSHPLSKAQRSSTARAIREAEMWLKSKKR